MAKRLTKLERELALALDVASCLNIQPGGAIDKGEANAWGNPSRFQDIINGLLVRAGREAIAAEDRKLRGRGWFARFWVLCRKRSV